MPCRAARPERGCTKPAYPSGISTTMPVETTARSPGPRIGASRRRRGRGPRRRRMPARGSLRRRAAVGRERRSPGGRLELGLVRRRETARTAPPRRAGGAPGSGLPPECLAARRSARPARTSPRAHVRRHRARGDARPRSGRRTARRSGLRSPSSPSPVRAETASACGYRRSPRRRASGSRRSILLSTSSTGMSEAPISSSTACTAEIVSTRRSSASDASTTWRTRSATSVSSSVAAKPSTSCVGSRRMNPTVSVTRYRFPSCSNAARRRVERLEEPVVHGRVGAGQRVQERRLPDVRIARRARSSALPCAGVPCVSSSVGREARAAAA